MNKVLIFTHGIDIDGFGGAILGKLAFKNPKIIFADNFNLDELMINTLKNDAPYDEIYVTDHCPSYTLCEKIDSSKALSSVIKVFDHHVSRKGKEENFDFVNLVVENEHGKQSGTSLFYEYLVKTGRLKRTNSLDMFTKLTTLYDTWEWKKDKELGTQAYRLNTLFQAVGRDKYIEIVSDMLERNLEEFKFSDEENDIIDGFISDFNAKIEGYITKIKIVDVDGLKVGYVELEDLYKNDIAEVLRNRNNPLNIAYLMMPLKDRESVSLRNIENIDLADIASKFGGGGHKSAASFPKSNEEFKLLQQEIKNISNQKQA